MEKSILDLATRSYSRPVQGLLVALLNEGLRKTLSFPNISNTYISKCIFFKSVLRALRTRNGALGLALLGMASSPATIAV